MNPMMLMSIASLLMGGFQALNSMDANGKAQTLSQQQQQQEADLMKQQAQEKANTQVQIGQNAQTAKAAAIKTQMGPENSGFSGMLLQPISNALTPGVGKGGKSLFGM